MGVTDDDTLHVYPINDLIEHELVSKPLNSLYGLDDVGCVCGPTATPVERDDGSIAWMLVHHSLDGREASE